MTFQPLPWGLGHDRKRILEHDFQILKYDVTPSFCFSYTTNKGYLSHMK